MWLHFLLIKCGRLVNVTEYQVESPWSGQTASSSLSPAAPPPPPLPSPLAESASREDAPAYLRLSAVTITPHTWVIRLGTDWVHANLLPQYELWSGGYMRFRDVKTDFVWIMGPQPTPADQPRGVVFAARPASGGPGGEDTAPEPPPTNWGRPAPNGIATSQWLVSIQIVDSHLLVNSYL